MDPAAFDHLSRRLAARPTRRSILAAFLTTLAPAEAKTSLAKSKVKPCVGAGGICSVKSKCCRGAGECLEGQCVCVGTKRCGDTCIPLTGCCDDAACAKRGHDDPCSTLRCQNRACVPVDKPDDTACGDFLEGRCRSGTCQPRTCATDAECAAASHPCRTPKCASGICTFTFRPDGHPLPATDQTAGDCQVRTCDGTGGTIGHADDRDTPPDAGQCNIGACDGGQPIQVPRPAGTPCGSDGTKRCNGEGRCVAVV